MNILLGLSEQDAQLMTESNENNLDGVTQIVLPSPQQDKMKKDMPQVNWNIVLFILNESIYYDRLFWFLDCFRRFCISDSYSCSSRCRIKQLCTLCCEAGWQKWWNF